MGKKAGFTLLELSVTLSIITILVIVALPTYHHQKTRVQRSEAISKLHELAGQLEQIRAKEGSYLASLDDVRSIGNAYTINILDITEDSFRLEAIPKQTDPICDRFILDSLNVLRWTGLGTRKECLEQ